MKRKLVAGLVATFLLIVALTAAQELNRPQTASEQPSVVASQPVVSPPTVDGLLRLVNEERAKVGVKPLRLDPLLNKSAQMKTDELGREGWDDSPHVNTAGLHGYEYIAMVGKKCVLPSENLHDTGVVTMTASSVIESLKTSRLHYLAMINPVFESVGFGISQRYVTQHFCDEK